MQAATNISRLLEAFAEKVVERAQSELLVTRKRTGIKAQWKDGKPVSFKKSKYWGKIDSTGELGRSLHCDISDLKDGGVMVEFYMEAYGAVVDQGRNPGKFAPPQSILKWVEGKPIKPRDADGKFVKVTPKTLQSMSFLINRKMKFFGIEPTLFFTEPFELTVDEYLPQIGQHQAKDIKERLQEQLKDMKNGL